MGPSRPARAGRSRHRRRVGAPTAVGAALLVGVSAGALAACDSDDAEPGVVEPADAFTAIVSWQAAEQEPVIDDDGEERLPVIYVVAADGGTIDVGVQAAVTEATAEEAVVRFADDANDSFDRDLDEVKVHDEGVMLLVGAVPEPARTVEVDVDRFTTEDDYDALTVQIRAQSPSPQTSDGDALRAEVTNATQR